MVKLLVAVMLVESSGGLIGDKGKSWGPMQIQMCVVKDVNRHYHTRFTAVDRLDIVKSRQMFILYTNMYGAKTNEERARMWNGGPKGHKHNCTLKYWTRVVRRMH